MGRECSHAGERTFFPAENMIPKESYPRYYPGKHTACTKPQSNDHAVQLFYIVNYIYTYTFCIFACKQARIMQIDFIKKLGYKALDSRLKRISDRMSHDVRKFYKELGIDVEPNWYLVFMLLRNGEALSIATIAERLGYSHPSVVIMVKKMAEKRYLHVRQDSTDKRKQLVSLSPKAKKLLPRLEKIWDSCEKAILTMLSGDLAILGCLDNIDQALKNTSFHDRFRQSYLDSNKS